MPILTMEGRVMAAINAERLRTSALMQPAVPSFDRGPCMYDDGIVAADDTCLRCKVKSGEDCKDI